MAPILRVIKLPILCSGGDATVTQSENHVNGLLVELMYVPVTIATGATVTVSVQNSDVTKTILTKANAGTSTLILYPRGSGCDNTGSVGSDGLQLIPVVGMLRVVVASGVGAGAGTLYATVQEDV